MSKTVPESVSQAIAELEPRLADIPQPTLRHLQRAVIYLRAARDGLWVDFDDLMWREQKARERVIAQGGA